LGGGSGGAGSSGQSSGDKDSLRRKGGKRAGQGASPQVVAVFGLSPFAVVVLALLASPFFCCQDNFDDTAAGGDGQQGDSKDGVR
jgi:hypothetical protein